MESGVTVLQLIQISKNFGGVQALKDVSLTVPKGALYGLIGPNGAGKTTLFNIITGFYKADSGQIVLSGRTLVSQIAPHRFSQYGIARTFQNIRLFPQMSVLDNVLVGRYRHVGCSLLDSILRTRRFREDDMRQRRYAHALLERMNLHRRAEDIAASLSYGEQRRLEIARALATEPVVLALDEPAAGMNDRETEDLGWRLQELRHEGLTQVLVEHDLPWVMQVCTQIAVLDFGELVVDDIPAVVRQHPRVISAYLGMQ